MYKTAPIELVEQVKTACPDFSAALRDAEVATFIEFCDLRQFEPDQVIADIGEVSNEFYLVLEGRVRLVSAEAGKELDVGWIETGQLAGEMSFFDRQPRSLRLRADKKQGVRLLAISHPMYKRLCVQHSYIAVNLLEFMVMSLDKLIRSSSHDMALMYRQVAGIKYS